MRELHFSRLIVKINLLFFLTNLSIFADIKNNVQKIVKIICIYVLKDGDKIEKNCILP
ncbi:hypothetical protein rsdtw13_02980 [Clostridium sp. TW13]|uniref:Uncharacterized protein n=1 Tax=Inconstantimicrobium mannanitabidum TaxID=1604901 RepID=A0ACB5R770_9CLOT|nr:hypothetical protein rsdtw13_02980 [Clostridium sp. TW13]